jgi:predicted negative regulator of RcsB-dependent stress response
MTEDLLTDDEQLEHVKRLTAEYGPWILGALVLGSAFVFGMRYYESRRDAIALHAAAQFDAMTSALQHNDPSRTRQLADGLIKDYPGSPYADQAKLVLARLYVTEGQDANAIAPLTEVMSGSKDTELRHIARLRLARVLIDQGKPDDALNMLADPPGAFAAPYHEVRGDAFVAKKDSSRALKEYQAALSEGAANNAPSNLLELKIEDLGVTASAAPGAPMPAAASASDPSKKATP